ncbi:uncharacterized protein LOC125760617 [Anopheles funestus]|uniref:uncharacterized protein LOC125760617 n=1 Tax=Anopheles funestus TaxID=62324 RepID=UPI0020C6D3B9|nr:uncharacterized protein LOC125760617 [Anopheles funestus]XP_049276867.1 uncharacterized protein LOC125760617 [Anopheles funestus]XP_049276868.1 uncharacterized protein LOC125760617 [Anopheles funestus]
MRSKQQPRPSYRWINNDKDTSKPSDIKILQAENLVTDDFHQDELENVGVERPDSKDVLSAGSVSPSSSTTPPPIPMVLPHPPATLRECKELPSEITRTRSSLAISSIGSQSCSPPPTAHTALTSGTEQTPEINERVPGPSAIQSQLIDSHDDGEHSIPATLIHDPMTVRNVVPPR